MLSTVPSKQKIDLSYLLDCKRQSKKPHTLDVWHTNGNGVVVLWYDESPYVFTQFTCFWSNVLAEENILHYDIWHFVSSGISFVKSVKLKKKLFL